MTIDVRHCKHDAGLPKEVQPALIVLFHRADMDVSLIRRPDAAGQLPDRAQNEHSVVVVAVVMVVRVVADIGNAETDGLLATVAAAATAVGLAIVLDLGLLDFQCSSNAAECLAL